MDETERITDPSSGSNELGSETREEVHTGVSSGTDTQTFLAAAGGKKHKRNNPQDKSAEKIHTEEKSGFMKANETDE